MIRQEIQDFLPAVILENYCLEVGLKMPSFQLLGAEGVVHAPVFAYKVSVADIEAVDTGQSKKKAKHAAAHGALLQLLKHANEALKDCPDLTFETYKESKEYQSNLSSNSNEYTLKAGYLYLKKQEKQIVDYQIPSSYNQQSEINSVGKLQEVCMKNKWTPPAYDIIDNETTNGHEKVFTMICEIRINGEILNEKGQGRSKKEAKRSSALKMLNVLESKDLFSFVEETDDLNKRLKKLDDGYMIESVPAKMKIDQFCSAIEYDLNKELDKLFECLEEDNLDFCEKLEELACYIECKTDYIDYLPLDDELLTYSSLVNLTPYHNCPPIVTGFGQSTESSNKSRNEAAKTALELFNKIRYVEL